MRGMMEGEKSSMKMTVQVMAMIVMAVAPLPSSSEISGTEQSEGSDTGVTKDQQQDGKGGDDGGSVVPKKRKHRGKGSRKAYNRERSKRLKKEKRKARKMEKKKGGIKLRGQRSRCD
jgi:hypothetical protein